MEIVITSALIVVLFIFAPWLTKWVSKSKINTLMVAGGISLFLVPVTLLVLNQHRLVLPQQSQAISWAANLHRSASIKAAAEWANQNFVFIDDSYSNELLPAPGSNQLGSSTVAVTNRTDLAGIFRFLKTETENTDLIVCDVYLDLPSTKDSILRDILTEPAIEGKLILADNPVNPNTAGFASLNDSIYGNIVEAGEQQFFSTYTPILNSRKSMAYVIYQRWQNLHVEPIVKGLMIKEISTDESSRKGMNSYIPNFLLTTEEEIYHRAGDRPEAITELAASNFFEIGDLNVQMKAGLFHEYLKARKSRGLKNIIFIGSFTGKDLDVHETYFGKLHGPTIILNLVYSLISGQHLLPFTYILYLWLGMTLVFYILVRNALYLPLFILGKSQPQHPSGTKGNQFTRALKGLLHVVVLHEIHFWIFMLFIVITALIWGKIINGFVLLLLVEFIYRILRYHAE